MLTVRFKDLTEVSLRREAVLLGKMSKDGNKAKSHQMHITEQGRIIMEKEQRKNEDTRTSR